MSSSAICDSSMVSTAMRSCRVISSSDPGVMDSKESAEVSKPCLVASLDTSLLEQGTGEGGLDSSKMAGGRMIQFESSLFSSGSRGLGETAGVDCMELTSVLD